MASCAYILCPQSIERAKFMIQYLQNLKPTNFSQISIPHLRRSNAPCLYINLWRVHLWLIIETQIRHCKHQYLELRTIRIDFPNWKLINPMEIMHIFMIKANYLIFFNLFCCKIQIWKIQWGKKFIIEKIISSLFRESYSRQIL